MKKAFLVFVLFFVSLLGVSQIKRIYVCDTLNIPIQYCSFINISKNHVYFTDELGYINLERKDFSLDDTILIKHISCLEKKLTLSELLNLDTIKLTYSVANLKEVVVQKNIDIEDLNKKETLGIFERRFDGAFYLHKGHQIGVLFSYDKLQYSLLSKIKFHFSELNNKAIFKVGIVTLKMDGSIGDNLLDEDIIIVPKRLVTTIDLTEKKMFLPSGSVFIYLECVNDIGVDKTISKIRTWNSQSYVRTFANFMNIKPWYELKNILPKKKYPMNAQIQIEILQKK